MVQSKSVKNYFSKKLFLNSDFINWNHLISRSTDFWRILSTNYRDKAFQGNSNFRSDEQPELDLENDYLT